MATNTALLGLVIGAFPSIFDKGSTSQKLVLLILILIVLILPTILLIIIQVPSLLLIILIASLDWFDDDTWLVLIFLLLFVSLSCHNSMCIYVVIATLTRFFILATVTSHWFYSQDYPNYLVNTKTCPIPTFHTCVLHLPNSQVDTAFKAVKGFITECCSKVFNSLLQPEDAPNP